MKNKNYYLNKNNRLSYDLDGKRQKMYFENLQDIKDFLVTQYVEYHQGLKEFNELIQPTYLVYNGNDKLIVPFLKELDELISNADGSIVDVENYIHKPYEAYVDVPFGKNHSLGFYSLDSVREYMKKDVYSIITLERVYKNGKRKKIDLKSL